MAWWDQLTEFLYRSNPDQEPGPISQPSDLKDAVKRVFITHAIDWLYLALGFFTTFYFWSITFLFFSGRGGYYFISTELLGALSEPYLGAVGIYVILKEIRKRKIARESRHYGEIYVWLWLILLLTGSSLVLLTKNFHFDTIMRLIITNSLASFVIYIAGKIHRP